MSTTTSRTSAPSGRGAARKPRRRRKPDLVEPAYLWVPEHTSSAAEEAIALAEEVALLPLDEEQKLALRVILAERKDGRWAALEAAYIEARQNGKALGVGTPILTTAGWKTMGTVAVGDAVYGVDGEPTRVDFVSDVFLGNRCYEVEFSDGAVLTVDGGHLWRVWDASSRRWTTLTTEDIAATRWRHVRSNGRNEYRYRVPCDTVVERPTALLPLDPYVFGMWLGDGTSSSLTITVGSADRHHLTSELRRVGYPVVSEIEDRRTGAWCVRFKTGEHGVLRRMGVWRDKHIPDDYLTASVEQRRALLAGLVDSDGSIRESTRSPQIEFSVTNKRLVRDVLRLARSLGIRTTVREGPAKINGRVVGTRYRVCWTPTANPFRLPRKANRYRPPASNQSRWISLVGLREVPSVPTRCIRVEHPNHLYLAGELFTPTHNTYVFHTIALADLFLFDSELITWSAHLGDTIQEAYRDLVAIIENTPEFSRRLKHIYAANGKESIELVSGQRVKFRTRTLSGGRGLTGDRVLMDEALMLLPAMMGSLFPTLSAVPNPQVVYGSSAGVAKSAILRTIRDRGRAGGDPSLAYIEWCADEGGCKHEECDHRRGAPGCALDDETQWLKANHALGKRITYEYVRGERRALPPEEFARERLGWWDAAPDEQEPIPLDEWDACGDSDAEPHGPTVFAIDVAPNHTRSSITICAGGVIEVVENRPGSSWLVARLADLVAHHQGEAVALDVSAPVGSLEHDLETAGFRERTDKDPAGLLVKLAGREVVAACGGFRAAVIDHEVTHREQPLLDDAVAGAARKKVGDAWKWSRVDSTVDITPLVTATFAWYLAKTPNDPVDMAEPEVIVL